MGTLRICMKATRSEDDDGEDEGDKGGDAMDMHGGDDQGSEDNDRSQRKKGNSSCGGKDKEGRMKRKTQQDDEPAPRVKRARKDGSGGHQGGHTNDKESVAKEEIRPKKN